MVCVLKGYFDESGTHDGAVVMCVAGFLFEEKPYLAFDRAWRKRLRKAGVPYFHMTDCVGGHGEFKKWKHKQEVRLKLVRDLVDIIAPRCVHGFAVSLSVASFKLQRERAKAPIFSDPYPLCINVMLGAVRAWCDFSGTPGRVAYFFESGHKKQEAAHTLLNSIAADEHSKEALRYRAHAFGDKVDITGLQAADLLAWEWRKNRENTLDWERPFQLPRKSLMALTRRGDKDASSAVHLNSRDIKALLALENSTYHYFRYDLEGIERPGDANPEG